MRDVGRGHPTRRQARARRLQMTANEVQPRRRTVDFIVAAVEGSTGRRHRVMAEAGPRSPLEQTQRAAGTLTAQATARVGKRQGVGGRRVGQTTGRQVDQALQAQTIDGNARMTGSLTARLHTLIAPVRLPGGQDWHWAQNIERLGAPRWSGSPGSSAPTAATAPYSLRSRWSRSAADDRLVVSRRPAPRQWSIGVSGGTAEQDVLVAQAGLAALTKSP